MAPLKYLRKEADLEKGFDGKVDRGRDYHLKVLAELQVVTNVTIHDVRGKEDEFNLNKHGFAYVKQEVEGFEDRGLDIEAHNRALVRAAEKIVKEMYAYGS